MAFYDYELTEHVKGKHELSKIEEVVGFSGLVYRFKDLANSVGRQGYGVEVGIKALSRNERIRHKNSKREFGTIFQA